MATNQELRAEIREFLVSRRARITPEQAGLRAFGTSRRVKGLRREEVATLAGVSAEYYTRVERGASPASSESVLDGIAQALQLDEAERAHLTNLVRAAGSIRRLRDARRTPAGCGRPCSGSSTRWLDAGTRRRTAGSTSWREQLGEALYAPIFADPGGHRTRPDSSSSTRRPTLLARLGTNADDAVALLRASAGRDPYDRRLTDLVGELATRSESSDPLGLPRRPQLRHGAKRIHHPRRRGPRPTVRDLSLGADPGQHLLIYTAEPDSRSDEALKILASWTHRRSARRLRPRPFADQLRNARPCSRPARLLHALQRKHHPWTTPAWARPASPSAGSRSAA